VRKITVLPVASGANWAGPGGRDEARWVGTEGTNGTVGGPLGATGVSHLANGGAGW
jgi:hypothetical protein